MFVTVAWARPRPVCGVVVANWLPVLVFTVVGAVGVEAVHGRGGVWWLYCCCGAGEARPRWLGACWLGLVLVVAAAWHWWWQLNVGMHVCTCVVALSARGYLGSS